MEQQLYTCTPENIMDYTEKDIIALAQSLNTPEYSVPLKVKLLVIKRMYEIYGFSLSNDLLLALLVEVKQQMILAPAGGCKTTSSQIKLILLKIFWSKIYGRHLTSSECLCLVYNAENRHQMDKKHLDLLAPLSLNGFISFSEESPSYVNSGITSHTLHSFCKYWINIYAEELKLNGYSVLEEGNALTFLNSAINKIKKANPDMKILVKVDRLKSLYDLVWGLNLNYADICENNELLIDSINTIGLLPSQIVEIFKTYDVTKKFFKKYDFTDMLTIMDKLLEREDVRGRMYSLYTCIVVDEIQDFTPLMMCILKKIVGPETRLLAIGDEDQSIYAFRGADIDNAVRFTEHFPESKVFQLAVNRRCKNNILNVATKVIDLNENRFKKTLVAEKEGGNVTFCPYTDDKDQMSRFIAMVREDRKDIMFNSVACVREKIYGQPLTLSLFLYNIPFYTLNVSKFYQHEAFRSFIEIMNLLWKPTKENWRNLYKIINIKKDDWFKYIDYDERRQKVNGFLDKNSLWELKFEPFVKYSGLEGSLKGLHQISKSINTYGCCEYIDYILELFKKNYWNTRLSMEAIEFSKDVFDWIKLVFSKDTIYPALYREYIEKLDFMAMNQKSHTGIAVATMHALKGLEFQKVYMLYMENSIFPAFHFIDLKDYSQKMILALKEAENRLAYVAMTRAIENLTLLYKRNDPSMYIDIIEEKKEKEYEKIENMMIFSNRKVW
jgi:DNA helicase-2/ATP-dependent DNA helicase PcrA